MREQNLHKIELKVPLMKITRVMFRRGYFLHYFSSNFLKDDTAKIVLVELVFLSNLAALGLYKFVNNL